MIRKGRNLITIRISWYIIMTSQKPRKPFISHYMITTLSRRGSAESHAVHVLVVYRAYIIFTHGSRSCMTRHIEFSTGQAILLHIMQGTKRAA